MNLFLPSVPLCGEKRPAAGRAPPSHSSYFSAGPSTSGLAASFPVLAAATPGDWPLLEGVTALSAPELPLPEHLLTHFCGCPAASFLSTPGSRTGVGVTCSSEPEAAPRRVGTGDRVLTSFPNSSEVGRVGMWRRCPALSPGYSRCQAASPRHLGPQSNDVTMAAGRSPGLGSGVLGWSPASSTRSGCVVLAKLPSTSEPCSLPVESQAAGGRGRFREVEGTHLAMGTVY